jgi:RimJ/RimL family protein N-acetyltransferase
MTHEEIFRLKIEVLLGKYINLRVATEKDAEFILELRLNPILNKYISPTNPSIEKQRSWIRNSFENISDFHFIIESKEGTLYGTVAIYNIDYEKGVAEWGRWVIKPGCIVNISAESMILAFNFAFTKLGLKTLTAGANNKNKRVVNFHKIYGKVYYVDENHSWFIYDKSIFPNILKAFGEFHNIQFSL